LNRVVQQKALQQQAAAQQQHYGLQQQQLANDLAYRNAALAQNTAQRQEAARQFDAQFGLNKQLTEAQIRNPYFGAGKDFGPMSIQSAQDAAKYNQDAENGRSEAQSAKDLIDAQHTAAVAKITSEIHPWALVGGKGRADLIKEADDAYTAALLALPTKIKNGDKVRLNPATGKYEALHMGAPFSGQPAAQPEAVGVAEAPTAPSTLQGSPEGPGQGSGENRPLGPAVEPAFNSFGIPRISVNPFSSFGRPSAPVAPVVQAPVAAPPNFVPAATNRFLRYNPNTGLLMPLQ
jgi:hypothetical protein